MLRLIGCLCILSGMLGIGQAYVYRIRAHYRQLLDGKELLYRLGNEMCYLKLPLPQLLKRLAQTMHAPYREVLTDMAKDLEAYREADVKKLWCEILQHHKKEFLLNMTEYRTLQEAGSILTHENGQMQEGAVRLYCEQISRLIEQAGKEMENRLKLCRYLSAAAGIFLILVLI